MSGHENRPLVTFALFAYNQEQFIAEAVQGAFSQTYSPLEIILSDDCSTDKTFEIMQVMAARYQGSHTIVLNHNKTNLGLIRHINRVMEMVKGELIVGAAGDDVSLPHRTERIYAEYIASRYQVCSLFSNAIWIDENGNSLGLLRRRPVSESQLSPYQYAARKDPALVHGCSHAWHRKVFDVFGPLSSDVGAEDLVIPFRSALLGGICYLDAPLVLYRQHTMRYGIGKSKYSLKRYLTSFQNTIFMLQAVYRNRLRDIDCIENQHGGDGKALVRIREVTMRQLREAERAAALLQEPDKIAQVRRLMYYLSEESFFHVMHLGFTHVFPILPIVPFLRVLAYRKVRDLGLLQW